MASVDDIVTARLAGRGLSERVGFYAGEATLGATPISELVRNIVRFAGNGAGRDRPATAHDAATS